MAISGRHGARLVLGAAVTALVAVVASCGSVTRAPILGGWGGNHIRYLWPVSLRVWFSLSLAMGRVWGGRVPAALRRRGVILAAAVCVGAGVLTLPVVDRGRQYRTAFQATAHPVVDATLGAVSEGDGPGGRGPVLVHYARSQSFWNFGPLVMAELADAGVPFVVDHRAIARQVGSDRYRDPAGLAADPPAVVLILTDPGRRAPDGGAT